ncbi:hypothetical protein BJ170DRAFT_646675 [Xylariales sp. AK1849]|nr:hypothetical protein BJ170DRAFT_646675 [Xylariales sp. AK1849]
MVNQLPPCIRRFRLLFFERAIFLAVVRVMRSWDTASVLFWLHFACAGVVLLVHVHRLESRIDVCRFRLSINIDFKMRIDIHLCADLIGIISFIVFESQFFEHHFEFTDVVASLDITPVSVRRHR